MTKHNAPLEPYKPGETVYVTRGNGIRVHNLLVDRCTWEPGGKGYWRVYCIGGPGNSYAAVSAPEWCITRVE